MNRLHHWYCNRDAWKRHVREELVPPELLAGRVERLTALEIDTGLAGGLFDAAGGPRAAPQAVAPGPAGVREHPPQPRRTAVLAA